MSTTLSVEPPAATVAAEDPAYVDTPRDHDGEAPMDDKTAGKAFLVGLIGGSLVMTALCFGMGILAGLDTDIAAAVAPVPGVVAGLFFGTTAFLGIHLSRNGH